MQSMELIWCANSTCCTEHIFTGLVKNGLDRHAKTHFKLFVKVPQDNVSQQIHY